MRLYPEDIVRFYEEVAVNDSVEIMNQPIKAGWLGEQLYLQVHDVLSYKERANIQNMASKVVSQALLRRASLEEEVVIDWKLLQQTIDQTKGLPQPIGKIWHPPVFEFSGTGWAWESRMQLPAKYKARKPSGDDAKAIGAESAPAAAVPGE
jgi:hypothetical protein